MELSIIVVNYNVRYFLQICLESLKAAAANIDSEIIVVDNASSDGSVEMIRTHFPSIVLIANPENDGFGRACNAALARATGRFILFINPDTVVGESLLADAIKVFRNDDKIGAVGVCLLDGNGQVLRESKRSIPSLWSSFTKFSGLSDVFRNTPFFNGYYSPGLNYDESGDIEVLPGAFMLIRKKVLDTIGGFDPRFFMYAEDIDLSYRITKAGYLIRYTGSLHVIHFKGESTEKSLTTYTSTFYHSMRLFIRKYTGALYSPVVAGLLQSIVWVIEGIQKIHKKIFSSRKQRLKPALPDHLFVLTNRKKLTGAMSENLAEVLVNEVPDDGFGESPFYLRYLPSYLHSYPDVSLILDFRSIAFEQIVDVWKMDRNSPFYVADGENSFVISSHNKENQGEVHIFEEVYEVDNVYEE